jgi:hypothetical protein
MRLDGLTNEWIDDDRKMGGWMDEWMNGWMDIT